MWVLQTGKNRYSRISHEDATSVLSLNSTKYKRDRIWLVAILGHIVTNEEIGAIADDPEYAQVTVYSLGDALDTRNKRFVGTHIADNIDTFGIHPIKRKIIAGAIHWQSQGDFTLIGLHSNLLALPTKRFSKRDMKRNGLYPMEMDFAWLRIVLEVSAQEEAEIERIEVIEPAKPKRKPIVVVDTVDDDTPIKNKRDEQKKKRAKQLRKARRESEKFEKF